jgi:hypothetical protein
MHATKAAVEEGIVAGGGVAYIRCLSALDSLKLNDEEQWGVKIVRRALEEPLRQITANAGVEGSIVVAKVASEKGNIGYNAQTDKYEDLVKAGIIDPTKVFVWLFKMQLRCFGAIILTTEAMIADKPEDKKDAPAGGMWRRHGWYGRHGRNDVRSSVRVARCSKDLMNQVLTLVASVSLTGDSGAFFVFGRESTVRCNTIFCARVSLNNSTSL